MSMFRKGPAVLSSSLLALIVAACDVAGSAPGESASELSSAAPGPAGDPSACPYRGPGGRGARGPGAMFERFDTDKDGAIAIAELPERQRQRLARADADEDGTLTSEELEAARPRMRSHKGGPMMGHRHGRGPDALFERFDTDKDGTIPIAELPEPKRRHLTLADANGDGMLTKDELQRLHDARQKRLDSNGDGAVSREERAASRAKLMAERFAAEDTNQDGFLTADEVPAVRFEHMKAADADADGKLSKDELENAIKNGTLEPRRDGRGPRGRGPMMAR